MIKIDPANFSTLVDMAMQDPSRKAMRPVIEKELLHFDILFALDQEGLLDMLTFQGGTCLRLSNIAKNLVLLVRGWIARGARAPLVRPRLLLNILLDHAQGGASDTSRKVAWTPQRVLPVGGLHQFRV